MMYLPSLFGDGFDDFFDDFDRELMGRRHDPLYGKHAKNLMKTDVRERDNEYELDVDLPGFKKEEIKAELHNGYLTIATNKELTKDETDKDGKLVRKERYQGSMSRSFFVGDTVKEEDIHAKYEDGVLRLIIPKKEVEKDLPGKGTILIEG